MKYDAVGFNLGVRYGYCDRMKVHPGRLCLRRRQTLFKFSPLNFIFFMQANKFRLFSVSLNRFFSSLQMYDADKFEMESNIFMYELRESYILSRFLCSGYHPICSPR